MVGGVFFAIGCFLYAWTGELRGVSRSLSWMLNRATPAAFSQVSYVAPCIGIVVILFGIFSI
jgi:hypothetical protein